MGLPENICLFLVISCSLCYARYTPSELQVGSGDGESATITSPTNSHEHVSLTTDGPGLYSNETSTTVNILDSITQFLKEYKLLAIVVGTLIVVFIVMVCGAVIMSHKQKASAYYPASFSQKEYVNQNDKCGGTKAFNEIAEKAQDAKPEEVMDSTKQLQADILNAAQNLKSPTKGGSIKEEQKIQDEVKGSQEETGRENTDNNTATNKQSQQESESERVDEKPSDHMAEPKLVYSDNEDGQKNQEEVNTCVEETKPKPCDCPLVDNSPPEKQETQKVSEQPADMCGV
ncbi:hypothetical protein GDO86_001765 [Hymenochirus boettgeri]|uniref:Transmembrane protein 119 n=1 Tax=Hymenochirus boettgeri TaxID=247094 RepID=A0A8T2KIE8_9PIPI|nr:hypothetical protein GDO86_001765 [Hymenochirus boettgeri]